MAKPAKPTVDEQVRLEVKQHGDRLAATMRRLASTLHLADCDQASRITRLRGRMLAQARRLTPYQAKPAFGDDIASIRRRGG